MVEYITQEGDSVDAICFAHYGAHGMENAVLTANPELTLAPSILPGGLSLVLPDAPSPESRGVKLW